MIDKINSTNAKNSYDPSDMDVDPAELASLGGLDASGKPILQGLKKFLGIKNKKEERKQKELSTTITDTPSQPQEVHLAPSSNSPFHNDMGIMAAEQTTGEVEGAPATVVVQPVAVTVPTATDGREPESINRPSPTEQPKETPAKKVEAVMKPVVAASKPKQVPLAETPTPVVAKTPEVIKPVILSLLDIVHDSPAFRAQGPAALVSRIKPEILPGLCKSIESKVPGYVNNLLLRYAPNLPATQRGIMMREFIRTVGRWMATQAMPEDMTAVLTWFQSGKGVDVLLSSLSRIPSFPSQQIAGILKTIQTKATVTTSPAVATSSQNIDIQTIWQNRLPGQATFISKAMAMKQSQAKPPLTSPVAGPQIPTYVKTPAKIEKPIQGLGPDSFAFDMNAAVKEATPVMLPQEHIVPDVVITAKSEQPVSSAALKETGKSTSIPVVKGETVAQKKGIEKGNYEWAPLHNEKYKEAFNEGVVAIFKRRGIDLIDCEKYREDFEKAVVAMCERLGINPNHFMNMVRIESAGSYSAQAFNKRTKAAGMMQIIPTTAEGLGTSKDELLAMTPIEQLVPIEKYLERLSKHHALDTMEELYAAVFYPASLSNVRKGNFGTILFAKNSPDEILRERYAANASMDKTGKESVTIEDMLKVGTSGQQQYFTKEVKVEGTYASQEQTEGSKEKMAQFSKNDITVHGDSGAVLLANYQGGYKNKLSRENEGKSSKRILEHMPQNLGKATIVLAGRNDMHPGGQETRENIRQIAQYIAAHGSTPILPILPEPKLTPIKGFAGPNDRYKERETYRQYMLSLNGTPIGNTGKRMIVVDCGNVEIARYDNLHPVPKSLDAIITQAISNPIA